MDRSRTPKKETKQQEDNDVGALKKQQRLDRLKLARDVRSQQIIDYKKSQSDRLLKVEESSKKVQNPSVSSDQSKSESSSIEVTSASDHSVHNSKWNEACKLINIQLPQLIPKVQSVVHKKYQIQFKYRDEKFKIRDVTIKFGVTDGKDFIDHGCQILKERFLNRHKNNLNPLDHNYWRSWLCNREETIQKAFCAFVVQHKLICAEEK